MRVTRRQLRRLIREAILREGYMVPDFPNTASMEDWIEELGPDEEVETDVFDPESGMVMIPAGETAGQQEWFEHIVEEPEEPEEPAEFDWDAWEREKEAAARKQREDDDRIKDKIDAMAIASGEDWARDTLHQAKNDPNMWKSSGMNQYDSPEEYVLGVGQDAAGDIASGILEHSDNEIYDWYNSR